VILLAEKSEKNTIKEWNLQHLQGCSKYGKMVSENETTQSTLTSQSKQHITAAKGHALNIL